MMTLANKSTVLNLIPHLGNFDYTDVIRNSQVRSQIIRGDKDKEINKVLGSTIEVFEERGDFRLVELESAGHFANLDQFELFNQKLEEFVHK